MRESFIIKNFITGEGTSRLEKAVKRFIEYQHSLQCKNVIGREYKNVHNKMDRKRGGGKLHREYGHTKEFVLQNFKGKERDAAYIHLLGDFVLDKFHKVLMVTLSEIKTNKIEPPYFYRNPKNKKWLWDVNEKEVEIAMTKWGKILAKILKNKKKKL